ncbi:MAG TPA: site-2 protease family protein [Terriglobales bacterium]|nr:site-2 protease family protein [Terriglobales bacterium]
MPDLTPPTPASAEVLRPLELIPLPRRQPRYWLHGLLLVATIFTTLVVGARMEFNFEHNEPAFSLDDDFFPMRWAFAQPSHLLLGVPYACTLMLILVAHELGHYLCCQYYGVYATLPFFIPAPTLIGTLGAFIRIRSPIRSRTALFDIGIAGPIAGFVVATTVLLLALPLSKVLPPGVADSDIELGYPLIFRLVWYVLPLPELKAHSHALHAIYFHPTAIAAWVGMFATALNLLPGGQLDGGHIVFSIAPRAHRFISRLSILALIPMALYCWTGWLVWAVLLRLSGMRHPVVAERPEVRGARLWLALFALLMLVLTLSPAPFAHASLLEVLRELRSAH